MHPSIILVLLCVAFAHSAKFPSTWTKCPTTNNKECLRTAVEEAIISLKGGNKALRMNPLEPIHLEKLELKQDNGSPVNIDLKFYDTDLIGASRLKVNYAKFDMDKNEVEIDGNVINGNFYLAGNYSVKGSVLILPIRGEGMSNITFEDFNFVFSLKGKDKVKDGKKYFNGEKAEFQLNPKKVHFYFGNLFDGVPNLGENMNKFLNENWQEIMSELRGTISTAIGETLRQIANQLFEKIPKDELYVLN